MLHSPKRLYTAHLTFHCDCSNSSPPQRISNRKGKLVRLHQDLRAYRIGLLSEPKKLLCLVSKGCHDRSQVTNQLKALSWFNSRAVPHIVIDGMDPNQRERRTRLFNISGVQGNYPQFFFEFQDGTINFLGGFDKIESLNETSGLPPEVLAQHPELETWDKVFGSVIESFD